MAKLPDGFVTTYKADGITITIETKELIKCENCYFFLPECDTCIAWGGNTDKDGWCNRAEKREEQ